MESFNPLDVKIDKIRLLPPLEGEIKLPKPSLLGCAVKDPIDDIMIKKKVYLIPCKDKMGNPVDKFLRVTEDSKLYNLLVGDGELPTCYVIEK